MLTVSTAFQASYRNKAAFYQTQNFTNSIFHRFSSQTVTTLSTASTLNQTTLAKKMYDLFKVFIGDILSLRNCFQGNKITGMMHSQIQHQAESVRQGSGRRSFLRRDVHALSRVIRSPEAKEAEEEMSFH